MVRVITSALLALVITGAHAQVPAQQLKVVDSFENMVSTSLKKYLIRKDTGRLTISKTNTASYQKQFYIDRSTNTLHMVTYLRMFSNGMLINETYYYLNNKPLSAYRIKQPKRKALQEETYYFYNDHTYNHVDSAALNNNEMKNIAEGFLSQYKKSK